MSCKTKLLTNSREWIASFTGNKNPGTPYEICSGLSVLLGAGLCTQDELAKIDEKYKNIKPISTKNNIIGLLNFTQNDTKYGTADFGIVSTNKITYPFSVTLWNGKNKKCICNPSGVLYSLEKNKILEEKNKESYLLALNYRKKNKGEIPNKKWKRDPRCPGSKNMCSYLADQGSQNWNKLDNATKLKNISKLLDLDSKLNTNSLGIIYWDRKNNCIKKILNWSLKIDLDDSDYLQTYSDGIYIIHGIGKQWILKTQTKYNNGIIEGMSSKKDPKDWNPKMSKNYLSSWNCVANLDVIFNLKEYTLKDMIN